jgi:hypothetical protein
VIILSRDNPKTGGIGNNPSTCFYWIRGFSHNLLFSRRSHPKLAQLMVKSTY